MAKKYVFHLLPNAHLDPVWLWDWREGLNEGIATCRTMLDLMRKNDDFTFIRGEAAIYDHIEKTAPDVFAEIKQRVAEGRWDVIGGNWIQPDTNMPSTTTFLKQYELGKAYFQSRFGVDVKATWAADSFGHSAGLPDIFAASGFKYFAFSRPAENLIPIAKPAFWWCGRGGARILCYRAPGWYGCERTELPGRLDLVLQKAPEWDLKHLAVFFGLGDHGGGSSRRQIEEVRTWAAAHPEVDVRFSTLHGYFAALEKEVKKRGDDLLPEFDRELNFCLRGCYSSAIRYKFLFRQAEGQIQRAAKTAAALDAHLKRPVTDFTPEWQSVAFNTFHDILPGSSMERAFDEQIQWVGGAVHDCRRKEFAALNALAQQLDTRVKPVKGDNPSAVPFVLFNPHPYEYRGHADLEFQLDYRPLWDYRNRDAEVPLEVLDADFKPLPFQTVATEHHSLDGIPFRKHVVFPVTIPAFGWRKVSLGYQEKPKTASGAGTPAEAKDGVLTNGFYQVEAVKGAKALKITRRDKSIFAAKGIEFALYDDPWGSWGGMAEEPDAWQCAKRIETWKIANVVVQENGPERAAVWVEFRGAKSCIQLTVRLYRGRDAVDCNARLVWNDRSARLKMVMDHGDEVTYDVPGGQVVRGTNGDVPGGRWLKLRHGKTTFGFASNAFYGFDNLKGEFGVIIARGCRYATDITSPADAYPDRPTADQGVHKCSFLLTADAARIEQLAEQLEQPPVVVMTDPHPGHEADGLSLLAIAPESVRLLDLTATNKHKLVLTVQNREATAAVATVTMAGRTLRTPALLPGRIYRFKTDGKKLKAE